MLFTVKSTRRRLVETRRREDDVVRRPSQRFAIQSGVLLVPQSGGNAAQEQQLGTPRHKNEVPANSHIDATLPGTQASEVRGAAARLESSPKTISILGVFYELSRARMAVAQISAQKLQRSFVALIGCRSPQEFFQLQNQLVKEQAELFAVSIYAPFLNQIRHSSEQVAAAL